MTLAHLKDKPNQNTQASTSSAGVTSGVRSAAARILGAGNGRALSFVGGNGASKYASTTSKNGSMGASNLSDTNNNLNFDGKGTYLIYNVGDTIFISDSNSQDKVKPFSKNMVLIDFSVRSFLYVCLSMQDPIKSINFSNSNPFCHAFDPDAKDGHDLIIGLNSGDGKYIFWSHTLILFF